MILMLSNRQRSDAESLPLEPSNLICVSAVAPAIDNSTCDHGLFITVLACFEHKSFVTTKSVPEAATVVAAAAPSILTAAAVYVPAPSTVM